jgi:hypothetical protein
MWECTDLLGQGSFGTVGLWRKYDRNGKQIDVSLRWCWWLGPTSSSY